MLKEHFTHELQQIDNKEFRNHVISIMDSCPQYTEAIPSASTGKYHPNDEINPKGMILHVKRCAVVAGETVRMREHTQLESDVLIASCLLHDIFKNGPEPRGKYTDKKHPIYVYSHIKKYITKYKIDSEPIITMLHQLALCCLLHEGVWTIDESRGFAKNDLYRTKEWNRLYKSMHFSDYYASRRSIYVMMQKGFGTV